MAKTQFHKYLTLYRKERGYTQAQMAGLLGVSRSTYTNYESGNRAPDFEMLEKIGDVLECSLDELFGRTIRRSKMDTDVLRETSSYWIDAKKCEKNSERKLAIGWQDFRAVREQKAYYVDKTQMIEEFLSSWYQTTLITRPRRFGKTLNMSMLAEFLDCTKSSAEIFEGTKISESSFRKEMNQHPVISLSFLNVKAGNMEEMTAQLGRTILSEYRRYYSPMNDGTLREAEAEQFNQNYKCLMQPGSETEKKKCVTHAIVDLSNALEAYYGKRVYLLLDEYDTPFITANLEGYYDEARSVLVSMLSSALKGNISLEKAMLTGIQRVAKENIFSGLNNMTVCTVMDREYEECFGFTEEETRSLLEYCEAEFSEDVREMYDGYRFGTAEVYNPWSVSCYAAQRKLNSYWVNTSENSILENALDQQGNSFKEKYDELIRNGSIEVEVEWTTAYYESPNDAALWGLLVNAGMLTVQEETDENSCVLRVPNQEVWEAFRGLTAFHLQVEKGHIHAMLKHLRKESLENFAKDYQNILLELPSYYDLKSENSYHMMMLGMCAFLQKYYQVKSNRESGSGRGDILLYAKSPGVSNMILEFKYTKEESENLEKLAEEAIQQAKDKKYAAGMCGKVYYIGLAHYGKTVEVKWEMKEV